MVPSEPKHMGRRPSKDKRVGYEILEDSKGEMVRRTLPMIVRDKKRRNWKLRTKKPALWRTRKLVPSKGEAFFYRQSCYIMLAKEGLRILKEVMRIGEVRVVFFCFRGLFLLTL